jgi:polygalacturonase
MLHHVSGYASCLFESCQILLPAGSTYYSGAIYLKSSIDFHVEKGAVLLGSSNEKDYGPYADALINAVDAPNISITGGGQIDGNASSFVRELRPGGDIYIPKWGTHKGCLGSKGTIDRRYMLMTLLKCDHLKITDITLKDAASEGGNMCSRFSRNCRSVPILGLPGVPLITNCGPLPEECSLA